MSFVESQNNINLGLIVCSEDCAGRYFKIKISIILVQGFYFFKIIGKLVLLENLFIAVLHLLQNFLWFESVKAVQLDAGDDRLRAFLDDKSDVSLRRFGVDGDSRLDFRS